MDGIRKIFGTILMVVGGAIVAAALLVGRLHIGTSDGAYFADASCQDRTSVEISKNGLCSWSSATIDQAFFSNGLTAISDPFYSMRVRVEGRGSERVTFSRGPARPLFDNVQHGERSVRVQVYRDKVTVVSDASGSYETRAHPRDVVGNALHLAMVGGGMLLLGLFVYSGSIWQLFDDRRSMFD